MASGSFGFKGIRRLAFELPAGVEGDLAVEESPIGRARLRYNNELKELEVSVDEGPYGPLVPISDGPWERFGVDVYPDSSIWNVIIGENFRIGSEKLRVVGDALIDGGDLLFGDAFGTVDVSLGRGAANRLDLAAGDSLLITSGDITSGSVAKVFGADGDTVLGGVTMSGTERLRVVGDALIEGNITSEDMRVADAAGQDAAITFADGQNAALSAPNEGSMRYNAATQQFEISENGGPFIDLATLGAGGWTDDGVLVRLTTATDTVAVGIAAMSGLGEKLRLVGDGRVQGNIHLEEGADRTIDVDQDTTAGDAGHGLTIASGQGGDGSGATPGGLGGTAALNGGAGGAGTAVALPGSGADVSIRGGAAGADGGAGGAAGGDININGGAESGAAAPGTINIGTIAVNAINLGNVTDDQNTTINGQGNFSISNVARIYGADGDAVFGDTSMSGAERLRVVGDARVEGKLTVTGVIDPTAVIIEDSAGQTAHLEQKDGQNAAVSSANEGRLRYNASTQQWEISENTGAYVSLASGSGVDSQSWTVNQDATAGSDQDACLQLFGGDGGTDLVETRLCQDSSASEIFLWTTESATDPEDSDRSSKLTIGPKGDFSATSVDANSTLTFRGHSDGEPVGTFTSVNVLVDADTSNVNFRISPETSAVAGKDGIHLVFDAGLGAGGSGTTPGGAGGDINLSAGEGGAGTATDPGGDGGGMYIIAGNGSSGVGGIGAGGSTYIDAGLDGDGVLDGDIYIGTSSGAAIRFGTGFEGQVTIFTLSDDTADAWQILEGSNDYVTINTTDGNESITFGNTTTNPDNTFLGTGDLTYGAVAKLFGADGDAVFGATAMSGAERLRVVGDARVEGKLTVTGVIDPTAVIIEDSAGQTAHLEQKDGQNAAVSSANEGRLRYNASTQQWEISENGGAYSTVGSLTATSPVNVTRAAASAGSSTSAARVDHKHDIDVAAPAAGIGGGNALGSASSVSLSDHDHAIRETAGPTDLTVGQILNGSSMIRAGSTLQGIAGFATWTGTRYYAVDYDNGSDSNTGFSDGTMALAGAVALKTLERLSQIFPKIGLGQKAVVAIRSRAGGATYRNILDTADDDINFLSGSVGYQHIIVRGTDTVATAGAVAFANSSADKLCCGSQIVSGTSATGYNPVAPISASSFDVQINGGGAPGLAAEPTLLGKRIRFSSTTTTVALQNACRMIHENDTDTITVDQDLPATPVAADIFYIEEPGVAVSSIQLYSGNTANTAELPSFQNNGIMLAGLRCSTGGATINMVIRSQVGRVRISFVDCASTGFSAYTFTGAQLLSIQNSYIDETDTAITVGLGMRVGGWGTISATSTLFVQSMVQAAGRMQALTFTSCNIGGGCYFGLGILTQSALADSGTPTTLGGNTIGNQSSSTVRRLRLNGGFAGASLALTNTNAFIRGVRIENVGASNCIQVRGMAMRVVVNDVIGTTGNTGIGLSMLLSRKANIIMGNLGANTFGGAAGQDVVGVGNAQYVHADYARTDLRDDGGNHVQGTAGSIVGVTTLAANDGAGAIGQYSIVRATSAAGAIREAQADSAANAAGVVGVTQSAAAIGGAAMVVDGGATWIQFDGVPTSGSIAYLSTGTLGNATITIPAVAGTNQKLRIGRVLKTSGTLGFVVFSPEILSVAADGAA